LVRCLALSHGGGDETARFHHTSRRYGGWSAARRARAAACDTAGRLHLDRCPRHRRECRGTASGFDRRNLILEERYAEGKAERVPELIAELLALNVDVLVTPGTPITLAAQRATSTIPIVCVTGNPVGVGLVASLAHPGGNITGLSLLSGDYSAKWLELLKEVVPKLHRVAVLWNQDNLGTVRQLEHMRETAQVLGLDLTVLSAGRGEIEASLAAITGTSFEGLVVTDDPFLEPLIPRIIVLAAQRRLPALYAFNTSVRQGGLMSYSANFFTLWHRAAGYVDRILKGALPADMPIEQATEVVLNINLKTAKALGLAIPPTLLAIANEVTE
jgi:putative ABC transport system substrate-binding protein